MLPLTFTDPTHYSKIDPSDTLEILGLTEFKPGKDLTLKIIKQNGHTEKIPVRHTFNQNQIEWFKAGSALNRMAELRQQS